MKRKSYLEPRRLLTAALWLSTPAWIACDVEWGGARFEVVRAPARSGPAGADTAEAVAPEPVHLPEGPVVFRVWRLGDGRARAEPILAVDRPLEAVVPDAADRWAEYVRLFADRFYGEGAELALYRDGERVGTFRVDSAAGDSIGSCPGLGAYGQLELAPAAAAQSEFVAAEKGALRGGGRFRPLDLRPEARDLAGVLADRLVRERNWSDSWRPRQPNDVRPLALGEGPPGFAATFLRNDSLEIAPPGPGAAALFVVADYDRSLGYVPIHAEFQQYAEGDKRAPRWLDRFDVDGDGRLDWIVVVYGARIRWYEVYSPADGRWTRSWTGRLPLCEVAAAE
jgi:hypothetical protein